MSDKTMRVQSFESATDSLGLTKRQVKRYSLDLLPRIIARLEENAPECETCRQLAQDSDYMLSLLPQIPNSRAERRTFKRRLKKMENHLLKAHRIVREGYYLAICAGIGASFGAALIAATDNPGFVGVGVALGVGIGATLDKKARDESRVL
ncbi:MAG: hypothetical protein K8R90_08940 [Candidatus Cloacimonetes bacterium]|nr:hypothetical protein [Candidatus Cloacimonadota bacterium]